MSINTLNSTNSQIAIEQRMFANQVGFQLARSYQIQQLLLALGSNHEAKNNLAKAKEALSRLGEVVFSKAYINPDYTAKIDRAKPMYTNQCAVITLFEMMSLDTFVEVIKQIEQDFGRHYQVSGNKKAIVSLDIDVLAVKKLEYKNEWLSITERYPFKAHEWVGVTALFS